MLTHYNNSDTVVLVLHEIYGVNEHIRQVCAKFAHYGFDCVAPNLLNGRDAYSYEQEPAAYEYYMKTVGFEAAFEQVTEVLYTLRAKYKKVYVLGYSVGATLAWQCSRALLCDAVIGFYGSRIRDYLAINPACPVLLFFPEREKSFDVDNLISQLNGYDSVIVKKLGAQHGFADAFSPSYDRQASDKAWREIKSFLTL